LKYRLFSIVGLTALVISALTFGVNTSAQEQGSAGFLISPVRLESTIDKGSSEQFTLTLENVTDVATTAKAIVNDFEPSEDESGQPKVLLDTDAAVEGNSFKTLVQPIADIPLAPREKKQIPVTLTVPDSATAGGYYGVIRFASADSSGESNVALSASVGTLFLVTVPGDLKESLDIVEITAAKNGSTGRFFVGTGEFAAVTRLKNDGNIHVKPYGNIIVTDRKGNTVETIDFNNQDPRQNVLPGTIRKFEDKLQKEYSFGKYTLTTYISYGNGNGLITAKNTFWVIPVWMVIVFVAILVLIIVGAFLLYRKLRQTRKHKVAPRR
jgi:hypothetical protein